MQVDFINFQNPQGRQNQKVSVINYGKNFFI